MKVHDVLAEFRVRWDACTDEGRYDIVNLLMEVEGPNPISANIEGAWRDIERILLHHSSSTNSTGSGSA